MDWKISKDLVSYEEALEDMEGRVHRIQEGQSSEQVWFLEHPPLYTLGTSAKQGDVLDKDRFPIYQSGRGGQVTYHGPGQRVGYVMLDLNKREKDLRKFVHILEEWLIQSLKVLGVEAFRREGRVGLWVPRGDGQDDKIAAIGVRVKKWVTFHGFALNVNPDLSHYEGIVPCGIQDHGVTSLHKLGIDASLEEVDGILKETFKQLSF